jgi:hypothetical protein
MKCHTPNCPNEVGDRSHIGLCKKCYGFINYWHKKPIKAITKRAVDLQTYSVRMNFLTPHNTTVLSQKRPKQILPIMPGEFRKGKKRKTKKAS